MRGGLDLSRSGNARQRRALFLVSSGYVKRRARKMAFHQQTPLAQNDQATSATSRA
jgi:hypothetical protein